MRKSNTTISFRINVSTLNNRPTKFYTTNFDYAVLLVALSYVIKVWFFTIGGKGGKKDCLNKKKLRNISLNQYLIYHSHSSFFLYSLFKQNLACFNNISNLHSIFSFAFRPELLTKLFLRFFVSKLDALLFLFN